jgi:hypothetical protein
MARATQPPHWRDPQRENRPPQKHRYFNGLLVEREQVRDWYTTQEFANAVGKAEFTIREYCRLGRLRAEKRRSGRGAYPQWVISNAELLRFQREGLLPAQRTRA